MGMAKDTSEGQSRVRRGLRQGTCALVVHAFLGIGIQTVQAQELGGDRFTFRGFGTLGVVTHDADDIEFRRHVGQGKGVESGELGFQTDSLAGLQLKASLLPQLDFTLQGVTRMGVDGDWSAHVTQAFLRYSPDESLVFRAGRFGYDVYLLAESRQVGYSYLAVRPSQDFYGLVTNDEVDGVDVSWNTRLGPGVFKARMFSGRSSDETALPDGSYWSARSDALGASLDYSYRSFTARVAAIRVSYGANDDLKALGGFLVSTGLPESVSIGEELLASSQESHGVQIGLAYDDGPLQAQVLYGHITSDSIAGPSVRAFQAQVGYRLGDWTPYLSFARSRDLHAIRGTGLPELPELLPVIGAVYSLQDDMRASQHSTSAGVRWDFSSNWAFKIQADFTSIQDSALNFDRRPPGSGDQDMTVLTAVVDFVF
jgi:hypothetical protein